jgi:hypothetical protein
MKVGLVPLVLVTALAASAVSASSAAAAFPGGNGRFAFDSRGNIFTVERDGSGQVRLTSDGQSVDPAWSPDGTRIAFSRSGFISVMGARGRGAREVSALGDSFDPAWSPNGKRLVFVHEGEIWMVAVSGGTPVQLTHDASGCGDGSPAWSPLGGRIAYQDGCPPFGYEIVVLRLQDGVRQLIPDAWDPAFTADGRGLVFSSNLDPDNPPGFLPGPSYQSGDLRGGHRALYSRAWCAEGAPCLTETVAAPSSSLANPQGVYVETFPPKDDGSFGGFCVMSASGVDVDPSRGRVDAGFCHIGDGTPLPQDLDWQPTTG